MTGIRRRRTDATPRDTWWWWILGAAAVGLAVRIGYILIWMDPSPLRGDAVYYHQGANLLATGHGFIHPNRFIISAGQVVVPGASHPPAYTVFLSMASVVGLRGTLDHQIWSALLGTGTVVAMALLARRLAGPRAGIIAAVIAALYPDFWLLDGLLHSETLFVAVVAVATLLAYRHLQRPGTAIAVALGAACGLAALVRAEQVALVPVLAVPAVWTATAGPWRRRAAVTALSASAALAVIAPWSLHNLGRFEKPVPLTTTGGTMLAVANCDPTYYRSDRLGSWSFACWRRIPREGDDSVVNVAARRVALTYAREHVRRLPVVLAARLGRMSGVYRPLQTLEIEGAGQPLGVLRAGTALYYPVAAAAVAGAVSLRRRRVPIWPLLVHVGLAAFTALAVYGTPRFRVGAEVALVALAAVAVDAFWSRSERRSGDAGDQGRPAFARQAASISPSGVDAGA